MPSGTLANATASTGPVSVPLTEAQLLVKLETSSDAKLSWAMPHSEVLPYAMLMFTGQQLASEGKGHLVSRAVLLTGCEVDASA